MSDPTTPIDSISDEGSDGIAAPEATPSHTADASTIEKPSATATAPQSPAVGLGGLTPATIDDADTSAALSRAVRAFRTLVQGIIANLVIVGLPVLFFELQSNGTLDVNTPFEWPLLLEGLRLAFVMSAVAYVYPAQRHKAKR